MKLLHLWAIAVKLLLCVIKSSSLGHTCDDQHVRDKLQYCHPQIANTFIAVLRSVGDNYSVICRQYELWAKCVDSHTAGCTGVLMQEVNKKKLQYTYPPYNCTMPTPPPNQHVLASYQEKLHETVTESHTQSSAGAEITLIQLWIFLMTSIHSLIYWFPT